MRIIAGEYRGRKLATLGKGDAGAHLRPTPDRVRESLFSLLSARLDFEGVHVLDLFAGTGALGLEALSRGAAHATFVENGRTGQRLICENTSMLQVSSRTTLYRGSALRLGPAPRAHDLVFLDPPYGKNLGAPALSAALAQGWLAPEALIVWEENAPQDPPQAFKLLDHRNYGDTCLTLLNVTQVY